MCPKILYWILSLVATHPDTIAHALKARQLSRINSSRDSYFITVWHGNSCRASAGPLNVSLSALGIPELRRTLSELTLIVRGPVVSEVSSLPPECERSAVTISNQCTFDVSVRQLGMDELFTVPAGSER